MKTALATFLFFLTSVHADRPNILWITSEDNSPMLGCYGDPIARTPHIDQFAKESVRYLNCFSNAAVCAPARQTLITGMYASSLGGQHMRSKAVYPPGVSYFPKYLRDAGYYTTNNSKTDYNGGPTDPKAAMKSAWDESSNQAHWRKRSKGQPFFAVFNITDSHESRLFPDRWKNRELKTDPSKVILPAHLPDLPETRLDMARYYDCLEAMDEKVGKILEELEKDGLEKNTIVFYYSDHGGSMPRGKSFTYDSGTRVPLLIRIPEKWATLRPAAVGATTDRLVSFVDFAPTVLSLAEINAPEYFQGSAFLGSDAGEPREYVHTFRGRRGERYDIVRGVRSQDYLYLRNYTPHVPVMQFNAYSFAIPGYLAWQRTWEQGQCTPEQARWFESKPREELYRIEDDPDNAKNLAEDPALDQVLERHRAENKRHLLAIRDSVFFPEGAAGREFSAFQDDSTYPLPKLLALTDSTDPEILIEAMSSENAQVRYWGANGLLSQEVAAKSAIPHLKKLLRDEEETVRILAARVLAGVDHTADALPVLRASLESPSSYLSLQALLAIDECNLLEVEPSLRNEIRRAGKGSYAQRVAEKILR